MKKLRMIVTSVIVLAIVGSALAFNAKKVAVFCVDTFPFDPDGDCQGTIQDRYIVNSGGTSFRYYTNWSGNLLDCTTNGAGKCPTSVLLSVND